MFDARRAILSCGAGPWKSINVWRLLPVSRRVSTVAGFYRFVVIDGYLLHSPAEHVRRPKLDYESTTLGLDRMELGAFLTQAAASSPVDHALAYLLGLLGLRVSEACAVNVEHLSLERGHRTLTVIGKGGKSAIMLLPPRVARAVDLAAGERLTGPVLISRGGGGWTVTVLPGLCVVSRNERGSASGSRRTRCDTASSPLRWTPGCR